MSTQSTSCRKRLRSRSRSSSPEPAIRVVRRSRKKSKFKVQDITETLSEVDLAESPPPTHTVALSDDDEKGDLSFSSPRGSRRLPPAPQSLSDPVRDDVSEADSACSHSLKATAGIIDKLYIHPEPRDTTCTAGYGISVRPVPYVVADDELSENENLQVIGEPDPADLSTRSDDKDEDDIPVRLLTDFSVYNLKDYRLVSVAELLMLQPGYYTSEEYGASGQVKSWIEDDIDDDDDDEVIEDEPIDDDLFSSEDQKVKLSKIIEFNVHHWSQAAKKLDSKIYIRTQHAWYILDMPSTSYFPFFADFWVNHRVLHLVVESSLANPRITYEKFVETLEVTSDSADSVAIAVRVLGRNLTERDVESDDVKSYVLVTLDELHEQDKIRLSRVPLVRSFRGVDSVAVDSYAPSSASSSSRSLSSNKKQTTRRTGVHSNVEKDVLSHRNPTVVTPKVAKVAEKLFARTLQVAGQLSTEDDDFDDGELARAMDDALAHHSDPKSIEWIDPADFYGYYNSVALDGVVYEVGDTVIVVAGSDDNRVRAKNAVSNSAQTLNSLGNSMWFCRICYMFEEEGQKYFHGQWFEHGSKTLLQESAHANSLYLLDACDDNKLESIVQKCHLRELIDDEDEPADETSGIENDFHHSFTFIEEDSSYIERSKTDISYALQQCTEHPPCISCGLKIEREARARLLPLPGGGFSLQATNYHAHDFVYLKPTTTKHSVYDIAQITKIKGMRPIFISVRIYGRYDNVVSGARRKNPSIILSSDERRLFKTENVKEISPDDIDGPCYVKYLTKTSLIDEWVHHDDHFYVHDCTTISYANSLDDLNPLDPEDFKTCKLCLQDRERAVERRENLRMRNGPLQGLELFSGAGGLGTGLDLSGFVETRWAVEFSPSAALTYAANHEHTTVYNQCSNKLLQHAIDTKENKNPAPLTSLRDNKTRLPSMPKPGQVDFIYGGPPCQSFSRANHCKKANDVRSTLVCNMLSYVEFYRPSYFLLENVEGLLNHPLQGQQVGRALVGGIKSGVVKFIVRALTSLGYQVCFKVLQAGQYGAPQNRKRLIFWGAKRGYPLPKFPIPTHGFPRGSFFHTLPTGATIPPVTRSKPRSKAEDYHQFAPFLPVTINDAIGDLPVFDWTNPHHTCRATAKDKAEVALRLQNHHIPHFNAVTGEGLDDFPGFTEPQVYAHRPQNRYQKSMRHMGIGKIWYQYTRRFGAQIVERVMNIPLLAGANHKDLPPGLQMNTVKQNGTLTKYKDLFSRMDGNAHFRTAMTTVMPNAKGGTLLHPTQKRIVTVQECARAQGFPDHYQFLSVNSQPAKIVEDQHRQIGNAVPVTLALQLGKALGDALVEMWEEKEREGSPEL